VHRNELLIKLEHAFKVELSKPQCSNEGKNEHDYLSLWQVDKHSAVLSICLDCLKSLHSFSE